VALLLEVDPQALEWALTSSVLASATKTKSLQRRVKDRKGSIFNRDSLAKDTFRRLFDHVVSRLAHLSLLLPWGLDLKPIPWGHRWRW
jgi:myosin heavy subunit